MKTVKFEFSLFDENAIDKVIADLEEEQKKINKRIQEVVAKMAERGAEIAREKVVSYDAIFTNELLNSIHSERKDGKTSLIVADSEHAAFVEFGTGQLGQEMPYPYEFPEGVNWVYNSGETIKIAKENIVINGILVVPQGEPYWIYPKNGRFWITQGMESRPFMYETALDLPYELQKIAKEVFDNA